MATVGYYSTWDSRPSHTPQLKTSKKIQFSRKYTLPPRVIPGITGLDIGTKANCRINAYTSDVTNEGLVIHCDSEDDTPVYSVDVNWLELASAALDFQTGEFSLREDQTRDNTQEKTSRRINFKYPFDTPPKAISFISLVDIGIDTNYRAKTYVTDIDKNGFTIHLDTWGGTRLYSMVAQWIAYPEDRQDTFSTTFNTTDVRPSNSLAVKTFNTIDFGGKQFRHQPKVFIALSSFDIDKRANSRIQMYADRVSETGLTWNVNTWADTVLYSCGGVILAFV